MRSAGARIALFGLVFVALAVQPGAPQSRLPNAKDVVAPTAYVSLMPVPRGRSFELAVVLKIRPGFHVNARETSAEYLIPTDLRADLPAGYRAGVTAYPKGVLKKFPFSPNQPLNVYEGTVTIRTPLSALADAPLGPQRVPLKLRYQACSDEVCLPPVTLALEAAFDVAAADASAKLAHPEIFGKK